VRLPGLIALPVDPILLRDLLPKALCVIGLLVNVRRR
jgi:hypothetical protein